MSQWRPPTELPDLRRAGLIALDIETKDDRLRAGLGSGWPFHDGYVCGVSVAYQGEGSVRGFYFPIRHPDSENFDPEQIHRWLRDHVASEVRFVTLNGLYDWGWLRAEAGIRVPPGERLEEIGALATLIDENRYRYGLEALCSWRGLPGKDEALLRQGIAALELSPNKRKKLRPQSHIWQLPARFVGPYAEADAVSTLRLFEDLEPVLEREGTGAAYRLECDLLPMVLEMRRRGIRIDITAAAEVREHLIRKRDAVFAELAEKLGARVGMEEIGRTRWLEEVFDRQQLKYPRTAKGNASFTAGTTGWMHKHPHWLPQLIVRADKYNNAGVNVVQTYILGHVVKGRVHAEIHPHRSDDGGTRSLRFSYSDPPLQLMPSRDEELTPLIRGLFLPEDGEVWAKPDVSQQEFRFIVHYAARHHLRKAQEAVERYRADPDVDFHALAATMTGLDRQSAKQVNFAKSYGAGVKKFADMIGKPLSAAQAIFNQYDRELPFILNLFRLCAREAQRHGYLELYDGARRHWDNWEVLGVAWSQGLGPCARAEAERRVSDAEHPWHRRSLRRADTHKAMNALIQGSAARHTKLWMRACWREGIVPLLQMHDALECSVSALEQAELVAKLGREAVSLAVPMQVDLKFGRNWADAKHGWAELQAEAAPKGPKATLHAAAESPAPAAPPPTPAPASSPCKGLNGQMVDGQMADFTAASSIMIPTPALKDVIGEPLVNGKISCPFHSDTTPSLHVYADHYHCFSCGAHGDAIDWLRDVEGLSDDEALSVIANWEGPTTAAPETDESDARALDYASRLWRQGVPIAGTPALHYLARVRRIDIDALPQDSERSLRFHPRCPFGRGITRPCLLALYRDVESDAEAGVHRIAVTPDVLNGAKVERRTLGRWPRARAIKLWPASTRLYLGEGLETVLAAGTRLEHRGEPMRPAWAAGSTLNMTRFPVIGGVDRLVLLLDHDQAGEAAGAACQARWKAAGRETARLKPETPGADFNDLVIAKLRAAAS